MEEASERWSPAYLAFVNEGAMKNATFRLHLEML